MIDLLPAHIMCLLLSEQLPRFRIQTKYAIHCVYWCLFVRHNSSVGKSQSHTIVYATRNPTGWLRLICVGSLFDATSFCISQQYLYVSTLCAFTFWSAQQFSAQWCLDYIRLFVSCIFDGVLWLQYNNTESESHPIERAWTIWEFANHNILGRLMLNVMCALCGIWLWARHIAKSVKKERRLEMLLSLLFMWKYYWNTLSEIRIAGDSGMV